MNQLLEIGTGEFLFCREVCFINKAINHLNKQTKK